MPLGHGQVKELEDGRVVIRDRVIEEYGVVIEFDGRLGHFDPRSVFRGHRRDNAVIVSGRVSLRLGSFDVHHRACAAATGIATVLRLRGWDGEVLRCSPTCSVEQV